MTGCDYNFNSVGFKELYDGYEVGGSGCGEGGDE